MTDVYETPPRNLRSLRDRLMHVSRRDGLSFSRLQQHIGVLVVSQFLVSVVGDDASPQVLVKGGSALELRRGIVMSRASRDLDAVTRHDIGDVLRRVADVAAAGWAGFTAVVTEPALIDVPGLAIKPWRCVAKLRYQGDSFVSVPIEISSVEAGNTDAIDWAETSALALIGLPNASPIPCMTVAWQVAQKLHAVTAMPDGGRDNDRAHDLVDLQILQALIADQTLGEVRQACVEVFTARGQQPWPPTVTVPPHWPRTYSQAVASTADVGLAPDAALAAAAVNAFIRRIEAEPMRLGQAD